MQLFYQLAYYDLNTFRPVQKSAPAKQCALDKYISAAVEILDKDESKQGNKNEN